MTQVIGLSWVLCILWAAPSTLSWNNCVLLDLHFITNVFVQNRCLSPVISYVSAAGHCIHTSLKQPRCSSTERIRPTFFLRLRSTCSFYHKCREWWVRRDARLLRNDWRKVELPFDWHTHTHSGTGVFVSGEQRPPWDKLQLCVQLVSLSHTQLLICCLFVVTAYLYV